ncbi:MAG: phosphoribosylglycinamide formyltransferase [Clostridia bacterium]|nr:phosphoribosylglycinamide formyltransferase [Clostridia bacterium]
MVNVAVLVSGGGTNLQALLDAQDRGELGAAKITYVVSNRKAAFALERAKNHNVETGVLSKVMQPDPIKYDEQLHDMLVSHNIDMIVLAGFLGILGDKVLERYSNKIVNIHPALIPSFCGKGFYGLHVHEEVLKRGCKVTGATAHLVTAGVDEGPILLQKAVDVLPGDTPEILQKRVMEQAEWLLLPRAVKMLSEEIEHAE